MTGVRLVVDGLTHRYDDTAAPAVETLDLDVPPGTTLALQGPSGCGKSTLLSLVAGLMRPTAGRIWVDGEPVHALPERRLLQLRATTIAVVVQSSGQTLLPYATARQNLAWIERAARWPGQPPGRPVDELLERLPLTAIADRQVAAMSGGEQQRVALAASLVHHPGLLVVDEPTSQLDGGSRDAALDLLDDVRRESGATMVIATHDPLVADRADRRLRMALGRLLPAGAA